jgi:acyl dehydratase
MAINLDIIGQKTEPVAFTYDEDTVILYALGIGAGVDELDFVYEKNLKVFPTFAVIPFISEFMSTAKQANLNMYKVLHGEQKIILHQPVPPKGTVYTASTCDSIYDKGDKGAILNVTIETRDAQGELLFENKSVIVDRSAGNFGGDRGPKAEPINPPKEKKPDFRAEYTTSRDQAALYRLSGDKNPLHIDPEFAQKGGFDRPILHGLCSFGFAGRAIVHNLCGNDPARLKSFGVRFMNVVYPGEELITEGWKTEQEGRYIIRTTNREGRVILGNAEAEIA